MIVTWLVNLSEFGGAGSRHGRDEKCIEDFGRKTWTDETTRKT